MVTRPSASYRAALDHLERLLAVTEEVHRTSRTFEADPENEAYFDGGAWGQDALCPDGRGRFAP